MITQNLLSKAVAMLFQAGSDAPDITQIGTNAINHVGSLLVQFKSK
jgi:hypothetical protein